MKKIFNISSLALAAVMLFAGPGCDKVKDFGDTNTNPNGTPVPVTSALLTRAIAELGGQFTQVAVSMYTRPGYYAQYFAETQYPEASLYGVPQLEFSGFYAAGLYDLENIIIQNTDETTKDKVQVSGSNGNQIAVAKILKAYAYWTITDRWGDVPYSEALKGEPTPKYDTQEEIYAGILSELKDALASFDGGPAMKGDIIYKGNTDRWKKLANSLRMLVALRMSKVYPNAGGLAANEFTAALNDAAGSISTNADNAAIDYPGGAYQNPWYNTYVINGRIDDAIASTMTATLSSLNDPRINRYGSEPTGFPYGLDRPHAVAVPPGWGLVLDGAAISDAADIMVVNAATVLFARAEAAERGWTSENAATLYNQAVTASLAQWGYSGDAATYLAQGAVAYGATDHLKKIGTQRWIALYPDGLQAWSEWRRTNFPELTPAQYATNSSGDIPRRFVYGTGEYSTNNEKVTEAVGRLTGGDTQDARVWWDKP